MRLAGLLLALLFHGGSPVELSPVDNQGCESDVDCAAGFWCDTTAQFCPLGQPGIPDPNVTGLLPPPVWVANNTNTGGEVEGCSWVAEDPSARCRVDGAIPYVGCTNPANVGRPDCEFKVLLAAAPAYTGCCETCGFGTCRVIVPTMRPTQGPKSQTKSQLRAQRWIERVWGVLFFFVIIIVLCRYVYEFVSRKRQQARERANGPIPVPPPNVNQEAAIARANLSWEVEREQYFTIWGFHLFSDCVEIKQHRVDGVEVMIQP